MALFLTDNIRRSQQTIKRLGKILPLQTVALSEFRATNARTHSLFIVNIDLADPNVIETFRTAVTGGTTGPVKVFILQGRSRAEPYQANALGADCTISANIDKSDMIKLMRLCGRISSKKRQDQVPQEAVRAAEEIGSLHDTFYDAVARDGPLPKAQIAKTSEQLAESLRDVSIGSWLDAVKQHNSYTYRHCMTVSGLAVAFAMNLGFSQADVQRISIGALMHDLGKVRIPIDILDKPGKLSALEREEINKHPRYSFEILRSDAQFSDEVLDMALHHHELLDGSGYPDGLSGTQISDPVRILTIVDIFSALIDRRSYKEPMLAKEAFEILVGMEGKLERALVKAFEPVAQAAQASAPMAPAREVYAS